MRFYSVIIKDEPWLRTIFESVYVEELLRLVPVCRPALCVEVLLTSLKMGRQQQ